MKILRPNGPWFPPPHPASGSTAAPDNRRSEWEEFPNLDAHLPQAILGVAYGYATGRPLGPHDFSGGVYGAAGVLSALGFEIINTRDRNPSSPS